MSESLKVTSEFNKERFAAWSSIASAAVLLIALISLHFLSPEFDPSWRMVSEYANGNYSWVLSLMFIAWGVSSWTLAFALYPKVLGRKGKLGILFLLLSGLGEFMASIFDINHDLHGVSAFIGIGSLPIAAMLINSSLGKNELWLPFKKTLKILSNLTWVSVVLMALTFVLLITTYAQSGAEINSGAPVTSIPAGVIALVGWANRLLIVVFASWNAYVALKLAKQ